MKHEIKVLDLSDDVSEMSGMTFSVEIDGKPYRVEEWHTGNGDGMEVYDAQGNWINAWPRDDAFDEDEINQALDQALDQAGHAYYERYRAEVQPVIDRIKAELFGNH